MNKTKLRTLGKLFAGELVVLQLGDLNKDGRARLVFIKVLHDLDLHIDYLEMLSDFSGKNSLTHFENFLEYKSDRGIIEIVSHETPGRRLVRGSKDYTSSPVSKELSGLLSYNQHKTLLEGLEYTESIKHCINLLEDATKKPDPKLHVDALYNQVVSTTVGLMHYLDKLTQREISVEKVVVDSLDRKEHDVYTLAGELGVLYETRYIFDFDFSEEDEDFLKRLLLDLELDFYGFHNSQADEYKIELIEVIEGNIRLVTKIDRSHLWE